MNDQIQELGAVNIFPDAHVNPKNGTDASLCKHLLTLDPSVLANNLKHMSLYVIHENITFAAENLR
jgi:hypothetical protein